VRIASLSITAILFAGCATTKCSQQKGTSVVLFRFAGVNWYQTVLRPESYSDRDAARLARGLMLMNTGHYREAKDCFRPLKSSKEHAASAYFFHGIAEAQLGRLSQADDDLMTAINKDPDDPYNRVAHAWVLCKRKKFDEAETDAKRATDLTVSKNVWAALHEVRKQRIEHVRRTRMIAGVCVLAALLTIGLISVIVCRTKQSKPATFSKC
jgi:tetratricopeptide (TPR) repeat protein